MVSKKFPPAAGRVLFLSILFYFVCFKKQKSVCFQFLDNRTVRDFVEEFLLLIRVAVLNIVFGLSRAPGLASFSFPLIPDN